MSEDDFTWIEEPALLIRMGDDVVVSLYDAAQLDPERLHDDVRHTRSMGSGLFNLFYAYRNRGMPSFDPSPLMPEDGAEDGMWSMVDLIDNYMEIHRVVNTRRVGSRIEMTAYTNRMSEGTGAYAPPPDHGHGGRVACEVEALYARLEETTGRMEAILTRAEHANQAGADTELGQWLAWSDDPNPVVREALIRNEHTHPDAIVAMTARGEAFWQLARRRSLPVAAIEHIYESRNHELKALMIEHPDAPKSLLERAIHEAEGGGRYDARTKNGAKARARLAERMFADAPDLDAAFGELRSLLDSTPCEEAAHAVFDFLDSALAHTPEPVAALWVPYARDHMRDWDKHDCTLPHKLKSRWTRHREIGPAWGITRVLNFQRQVAGAPDSAWDVFADSPHLAAVESLGIRQQVDEYALGCIARASLPSMNNLVLINWGEAPASPDASVLAEADWVPQLEHIMLGSYAFPSDALARMLARASKLEWLTLFGIGLDASHVDELVASGAHASLNYLSVHDAECADAIDALSRAEFTALEKLQLHNVDVPKSQLSELAAALPGVKITLS